jgi:hypothetical protein
MAEILGIVSACGLVVVVGLGFVAWERYERRRLTRERLRRRAAERRPARPSGPPVDAGRRAA